MLFKKKKNEDVNETIILLLISVVGVLIGSHLLYGITNIDEIIKLITHFNKLFLEFEIFVYITYLIFILILPHTRRDL